MSSMRELEALGRMAGEGKATPSQEVHLHQLLQKTGRWRESLKEEERTQMDVSRVAQRAVGVCRSLSGAVKRNARFAGGVSQSSGGVASLLSLLETACDFLERWRREEETGRGGGEELPLKRVRREHCGLFDASAALMLSCANVSTAFPSLERRRVVDVCEKALQVAVRDETHAGAPSGLPGPNVDPRSFRLAATAVAKLSLLDSPSAAALARIGCGGNGVGGEGPLAFSDGDTLVNVAWAFSAMRAEVAEREALDLFRLISRRLTERGKGGKSVGESMELKDLALCLWAFAKAADSVVGLAKCAEMRAAVSLMMKRVIEWRGKVSALDVSNAAWALAKCPPALLNSDLRLQCWSTLVSFLSEPSVLSLLSARQLSVLGWACALIETSGGTASGEAKGVRGKLSAMASAERFLPVISNQLMEPKVKGGVGGKSRSLRLHDMSPQGLANVCWAHAKMGVWVPSRMVEAVVDWCLETDRAFLKGFGGAELANLSVAFARRHEEEGWRETAFLSPDVEGKANMLLSAIADVLVQPASREGEPKDQQVRLLVDSLSWSQTERVAWSLASRAGSIEASKFWNSLFSRVGFLCHAEGGLAEKSNGNQSYCKGLLRSPRDRASLATSLARSGEARASEALSVLCPLLTEDFERSVERWEKKRIGALREDGEEYGEGRGDSQIVTFRCAASTAWALGSLLYHDTRLLRAVASFAVRELSEFSLSALSQLCMNVSRLGFPHPALFIAATPRVIQLLGEEGGLSAQSGQHVAMFAWALAVQLALAERVGGGGRVEETGGLLDCLQGFLMQIEDGAPPRLTVRRPSPSAAVSERAFVVGRKREKLEGQSKGSGQLREKRGGIKHEGCRGVLSVSERKEREIDHAPLRPPRRSQAGPSTSLAGHSLAEPVSPSEDLPPQLTVPLSLKPPGYAMLWQSALAASSSLLHTPSGLDFDSGSPRKVGVSGSPVLEAFGHWGDVGVFGCMERVASAFPLIGARAQEHLSSRVREAEMGSGARFAHSSLQGEVAGVLRSIVSSPSSLESLGLVSLEVEEEAQIGKSGRSPVDFLLRGQQGNGGSLKLVALEVDGEPHFCKNVWGRPTGATVLRDFLIRSESREMEMKFNAGWAYAIVSQIDWKRQESLDAKRNLLLTILKRQLDPSDSL
uniref:RAP domain-containing protein n=1 Tax=Chromera velia CCMP2878 TaxID=1169474 RepID=A0A0G4I4G5_9ALVE|eukprot:Cvel_1795.t1-p1 / transcript=Cvel_1795.t1 / gene=Cvel_1795 / organism=Chromera_velia_CCMP2878 / gene_product=hypothetical protein / transcript_product=hypothetical protein / location=Cvel_scaffold66:42430-45879(+) / protein_length=1150 / sequence_SO=supercontig / SO=protein_coding / is_pseudo=false